MLSSSGEIDFTEDLMDLVDGFLEQYQRLKGPLNNDLERGLVIAYVLGVLRCDIEHAWDSLGQADVFGALKPRMLFEECSGGKQQLDQPQQAELLHEMIARGWFSRSPRDAQ